MKKHKWEWKGTSGVECSVCGLLRFWRSEGPKGGLVTYHKKRGSDKAVAGDKTPPCP